MTEALIKQTLKKEDPVELPMNAQFYEDMHNNIMQTVAKTEIKQLNRWAKTWVFLEPKTPRKGL